MGIVVVGLVIAMLVFRVGRLWRNVQMGLPPILAANLAPRQPFVDREDRQLKNTMNDWGIQFIEFTNTSPLFKGGATVLVGLLALVLFAWFVRKNNRQWEFGQKVFLALSVFIILYGLSILVLQPHWWDPPYQLPPMK